MTSAPVAAPADRAAVHRRTLGVLWSTAVLSRGAVSAMFPVSVLAVKDILGDEQWAGVSSAATTVGAALSAGVLAAFMQRRGRNPGLTLGFAVATAGGVLCILAIEKQNLLVFLLGMILIGVGSGTSNLARYAAADLASDERRSRDISTVIFAATFGAVFFPLLIGVAGDMAESVSLDANAGGFGLAFILFALSTVIVWVFMRPDPLAVAGQLGDESPGSTRTVSFRQALEIAWSRPMARLAFVALIVAQAVMVMVMAMTPIHMEAHGHSKGVVGQVISAHTAGMFAFAPAAGWLADRFGRVSTIAAGGATLIAATVLTSLAGEAPRLLMFPGLFLLGLGWSIGIVAGSALLTESVDESDRVAVQGAADTATAIASGIGALASGLVVDMAGFHILSFIGMAASGAMLLHASFESRLASARM